MRFVLQRSRVLKSKLEDTTDLLKQANFCKLFFLSFYKDFEFAVSMHDLDRITSISESYKLNSINLEMDRAED